MLPFLKAKLLIFALGLIFVDELPYGHVLGGPRDQVCPWIDFLFVHI